MLETDRHANDTCWNNVVASCGTNEMILCAIDCHSLLGALDNDVLQRIPDAFIATDSARYNKSDLEYPWGNRWLTSYVAPETIKCARRHSPYSKELVVGYWW